MVIQFFNKLNQFSKQKLPLNRFKSKALIGTIILISFSIIGIITVSYFIISAVKNGPVESVKKGKNSVVEFYDTCNSIK